MNANAIIRIRIVQHVMCAKLKAMFQRHAREDLDIYTKQTITIKRHGCDVMENLREMERGIGYMARNGHKVILEITLNL